MLWPGAASADLARAYRDLSLAAPDAVGSALVYLTALPEPFVPEDMVGKQAVGLAYLYAGDPAAGAEHAAPFRELGPAVDLVGDMNYADFQCMIDDPPNLYNYWSADYHDELPDAALDVIVDSARRLPGAHSQQLVARWGARSQDRPPPARRCRTAAPSGSRTPSASRRRRRAASRPKPG